LLYVNEITSAEFLGIFKERRIMKALFIKIQNFRNLDGLEITLNPEMNFLVGENDLGKSNFLELLDIIFNRRYFSRNDFFDESKKIEVKVSLRLEDDEIGTFEDYFSPLDKNVANFIARQEGPEESIAYFRAENYGTDSKEINFAPFRGVNYIKYDSIRAPKEELGFDKDRGVGKFLNFLVRDSIETTPLDSKIINDGALDSISQRLNSLLTKIKPLKKMGVGLFSDQRSQIDLITRILLLKGSNDLDIQKSGYGILFSVLLILSILERLTSMKVSRRWKENILILPKNEISKVEFDNFLEQQKVEVTVLQGKITLDDTKVKLNRAELDENIEIEKRLKRLFEKRVATIILGIDEPEVHLHPYMQRSLIKYIQKILTNRDEDFHSLLRELFDLDEINGQALVVSHSPNILLNDYKQVTRFFYEAGKVNAISGTQLNLDLQIEKHLLMNFPDIKEAFFSRCVIVVEGKSEFGAMSVWKDKHLDADDFGISIIGADGMGSIRPITKLLNDLKIPNFSVMDRDEDNPSKYGDIPGIMFTVGRDFEEDSLNTFQLNLTDKNELLRILEYVPSGLETSQANTNLQRIAGKYNIPINWDRTVSQFQFDDEILKTNTELQKSMFLGFMNGVKSVTFGRFMAREFDWIPPVYASALDQAVRLSESLR